MTEQTKQTDSKKRNGWVLYDGDCPMCVRLMGRIGSVRRPGRETMHIIPCERREGASNKGFQ